MPSDPSVTTREQSPLPHRLLPELLARLLSSVLAEAPFALYIADLDGDVVYAEGAPMRFGGGDGPAARIDGIFASDCLMAVREAHLRAVMRRLRVEVDLGSAGARLLVWPLPAEAGFEGVAGLLAARPVADDVLAALRASEARLTEIQRLARIGSWEIDLRTDRLSWSDEVYRIFEVERRDFGASYEALLACVHPSDRNRLHQVFTHAVASLGHYEVAHRLRMEDGRVKHVLARGEVIVGCDGRAERVIGTMQDITALRERDRRIHLLAMAFEHSSEAKLICDAENRILEVNSAFLALTGYERDEVIGQNPRILSSGLMDPGFYRHMWQLLLRDGAWQGEIVDRRKDGSFYPKWLSLSLVRDDEGRVTHYLGSFLDISERKRTQAQLEYLAHNDSLTGLANRFSLEARLAQATAAARRQGDHFAVMFIDLDGFKTINDSLGHHHGDEVLREVARRLSGSVRESDVVARLGGDEFVVLLSPPTDRAGDVIRIAEKMMAKVSEPIRVEDRSLHVSASIGISLFPDDAESAEQLLQHADTAMYQAKAAGRDAYHFFSSEMHRRATERLEIESFLREVLKRPDAGELVLHYQPQFASHDGAVVGFEALLRLRHPQLGWVPPAQFIPLAEETGLIIGLGDWVLDAACGQMRNWIDAGFEAVPLSINLSSRQFRQRDFEARVAGRLSEYGLDADQLAFEITESAVMEQPERIIETLKRLKHLGVGLSVDDFGTGYSSLAYLKRLPLDMLKIDRSFVADLESDGNDAAIASATIALAHKLGLVVVGEGVETEFQARFLRDQGCDWQQGYLYSRPVSADVACDFLRPRMA